MSQQAPIAPTFIRLFVAVPLPEQLKDVLEAEAAAFAHPALRFVPRQNLHLTLHFIGNVSPDQYENLNVVLQQLAALANPFRLTLQDLAPGPTLRNPRLLWARFEAEPLYEQLSIRMAQVVGITKNPHLHPIPHVTLARFRKDSPKPMDLPLVRPEEPAILEVSSFALWQSTLQQPHPDYRILREYPFTSGP